MMAMAPSGYPHGMQPQHPPGHPMAAPGMAHNPSQPGTQAGAIPQHLVGHMGVSAAGGQMNPAAAMMGGLPQGNPNAHAMQQLSHQQQQMFQQQQQMNPMYQNPMFQQQQVQQAQLNQQRFQAMQQQQQHARQQLMAQQGYGMPMGMPMNAVNPAFAAMRSRMPMSQQQAMIQQQLALQQQGVLGHMQPGGGPNQHGVNPNMAVQMQQVQIQALQQQQAAQQQAAAAAQAQAAQQAQAHQAHQGQAQPPPQQQQQPQPQQPQPGGPQQPNAQQQPPQGGPTANGVPQQGPSQGPTPQPNPQQQPQAPPQTPQQNPAQQAQQMAQAQQQAAAAAAVSNGLMQQQKREGMKGHCLLRLMQFGEHLSGYSQATRTNKDDMSYWNTFVATFFSQSGVFRHTLYTGDGDEQSERQPIEITYPAIARYFHTHFDSGVTNIQLILDKGTIDKALPNGCHLIENSKASFIYWFEGGSHLVATGILRASFDQEQKLELFEFTTTSHEEYLSRKLVIQAAKPSHEWIKEWHKVNSQDSNQSPEMNKKGKVKLKKSPGIPPPEIDLPQSCVLKSGVTEAVQSFLEIVEVMGQMTPLIGYYHAHPGLSPYNALEQYVQQLNATGQNVNGQPMSQGAGPRTPGFNQFPVASPALGHQVLPGSPHVGSPAPGQMQAPGMQLQPSQQGTSSSGPSANTSPSQNNKKRRASAIKNEDDGPGSAPTPGAGGTPQLNGIPSKAKPSPSMAKRIKGNPA